MESLAQLIAQPDWVSVPISRQMGDLSITGKIFFDKDHAAVLIEGFMTLRPFDMSMRFMSTIPGATTVSFTIKIGQFIQHTVTSTVTFTAEMVSQWHVIPNKLDHKPQTNLAQPDST